MAGTDSVVQITEGSGKYLGYTVRSMASNTVYQQHVLVSEPYLPTYTVSVTTAVAVGANDHLLQIIAGPLNRVLMRRLLVTQLAGASASTKAVMQLLRLTTAGTGGTAYTPRATDPTSDTTGATARAGVSASKGTEGNILWTGTGTYLATAATAGATPILDLVWDDPRSQPPTIAAGTSNGLALKAITAITTGTIHIYAEFSEAFWS